MHEQLSETVSSRPDDNLSKHKFPAIVDREMEHILPFIVQKQWNYHNYLD